MSKKRNEKKESVLDKKGLLTGVIVAVIGVPLTVLANRWSNSNAPNPLEHIVQQTPPSAPNNNAPTSPTVKSQPDTSSVQTIDSGSSYIDSTTGVIIGVEDVSLDMNAAALAHLNLKLPGADNQEAKTVRPGDVIYFSWHGHKYGIVIQNVEYVGGTVTVNIIRY